MSLKTKNIEKIIHEDGYPTIKNNTYIFNDKEPIENSSGNSLQGKIQSLLKKFGNLYYLFVSILGPVLSTRDFSNIKKKLLNKYSEMDVVLNIGSGPNYYKNRKDFINVDIYNFTCTDIVIDAIKLPIKDNSVDHIVNMAMLEHTSNPNLIVSEMYRVLKKNGEVLCFVPFISPFHAAPYDFYRWTRSGAKELFNSFDEVNVGIGAGPTSGFLWVIQEWLSIIFSFGNSSIKDIIFIFLMLITFPIKYLDILLEKYPHADKIASGFYIHAKK